MNQSNTLNEKILKEHIRDHHDGKTYNQDDLIATIKTIGGQNKCADMNPIYIFITKYIYYSPKDKHYFFNIKRRHTQHKPYHHKILETMGVVLNNTDQEDQPIDKNIVENIENNILEKNKNEFRLKFTKTVDEVYTIKRLTSEASGPYGTQWIHDKQFHDEWTDVELKRFQQYEALRAIILPDQRTPEWYEMRDGKITASSGATAIDLDPYKPQYSFITDKIDKPPFTSNKFCYHGKKYEEIATLIYEYRMNIQTGEFGLIEHPKYKFLGASPDRICNGYKMDGIHKSKYVGRMLEIKCPLSRKIKTSGEIIDGICPLYYWIQVQLQLECCNLDECDFWQCEIEEYLSREEFVNDTHPEEPFRSKKTGNEKGCVIQLIPKSRVMEAHESESNYENVVFEESIFIYPSKIELSPAEIDKWISVTLDEINTNEKYKNHVFDRVLYWRLVMSKNVLIERDHKWFLDNLPKLKRTWDYVLFFKDNKNKGMYDILKNYIKLLTESSNITWYNKKEINKANNKEVMKMMELFYNGKIDSAKKMLNEFINRKKEDDDDENIDNDEYMFD